MFQTSVSKNSTWERRLTVVSGESGSWVQLLFNELRRASTTVSANQLNSHSGTKLQFRVENLLGLFAKNRFYASRLSGKQEMAPRIFDDQ